MVLTTVFTVIALAAGAASPGAESVLKPPKHGGVYVMAHRGAHQGIPENTLAAYQKAIDLGVDFVEIDVRTTKDGKFVICHNATIDAYTNGGPKGAVRDYTLAELKSFDIGSRVGPQFKDERMPTFEEVLDLCKGKIGIYLDLKDASIPELLKLIRARGMEHDIVWYMNATPVSALKEACPECIPMPDPGPEKFLPEIIKANKPLVIASDWDNYTESFAKTCHAAHAIVIVDCMDNNPEYWAQAMKWHTDGLSTNYPEELIAWLEQNAGKNTLTK